MKPNVLIGTPAYGGMVHTDYVHGLIGIESAKDAGFLNYSLMTIGNESLITRARNSMISYFYHNINFTHLCFIDADLGFPKETLPLLLNQNKDVIGVPVPLKGYNKDGKPVYNISERVNTEMPEKELSEVNYVGNALLMLSRKAVGDLCRSSNKYKPSNLTRGDKQFNWQYDVFQVGVKDEIYLSEDYFICSKLKEMGYKIYIHENIQIKHNGNWTFV